MTSGLDVKSMLAGAALGASALTLAKLACDHVCTKDATFSMPSNALDLPGLKDRHLRKAETVLQRRTSRLLIVVERSTQSHNYTAIIRTAEALGIQHLWVIAPPSIDGSTGTAGGRKSRKGKDQWKDDQAELERHCAYARGAVKWVSLRAFSNTTECIEALRADGRKIWVTDLSQKAECLGGAGTSAKLPEKLALCFGSEATGATPELLDAADRRVYLPLNGFADSLNLSVAAALCMQRLIHISPDIVGDMPESERRALRRVWYERMARNDEERSRFLEMADRDEPIEPFGDCRRHNEHRKGWLTKKMARRNLAAGFGNGVGH
jgi:tRNA(Leu) C34 or U34 (ribose-2'-O)-methylase TrmL